MDGPFYNDLRAPFISGNITAVTLSTTAKAMYPKDNFPVLGGNYFNFIGKKLKIRLFGRATTAATPGNFSVDVYYGSGADATGTIISSSGAVAMVAGQTDLAWELEYVVSCRTLGAAGTLFGCGHIILNEAVLVAHMLIPASTPAASGTLDLTTANIISVQFKRSGSTAETAQVHDMEVIALN